MLVIGQCSQTSPFCNETNSRSVCWELSTLQQVSWTMSIQSHAKCMIRGVARYLYWKGKPLFEIYNVVKTSYGSKAKNRLRLMNRGAEDFPLWLTKCLKRSKIYYVTNADWLWKNVLRNAHGLEKISTNKGEENWTKWLTGNYWEEWQLCQKIAYSMY